MSLLSHKNRQMLRKCYELVTVLGQSAYLRKAQWASKCSVDDPGLMGSGVRCDYCSRQHDGLRLYGIVAIRKRLNGEAEAQPGHGSAAQLIFDILKPKSNLRLARIRWAQGGKLARITMRMIITGKGLFRILIRLNSIKSDRVKPGQNKSNQSLNSSASGFIRLQLAKRKSRTRGNWKQVKVPQIRKIQET